MFTTLIFLKSGRLFESSIRRLRLAELFRLELCRVFLFLVAKELLLEGSEKATK
jgi:hypothetical protein